MTIVSPFIAWATDPKEPSIAVSIPFNKEPATVDLMMLLAKEVSVIPAMGYEQEFGEVIDMLASGRLDPTVMVTHHFGLSDIQEAFAAARDSHNAIKVMIDCQS